ncbi:FimV/HubP family polar landmark protein [Thalassolituus sp. LLYu03]|uniref:FimV/HubP family polar landmark protein n=1 Tax=Thalassolituus sp. LLYu03 TaxID=3421656 RepID=UPI003D2B86A2
MKRLLANTLMMVGGMTASTQLLALGLGELELKSALNQPLKAEIELVETQGLTQWEIKPTLASEADFERAGVDRLFFLTKISFKVDGDKIILSSREPVNEPFLNFLIELNWPSGRVLREYTVLLDPPTFQEQSIQPLVATPYAAGQQETVIQTPAAPVAVNRWESEPAAPGTYKVQPNDTLWAIALATRPDRSVSPQQMMVAIQEANPQAFIGGNINRLKTHQVLDIPDAQSIRDVSFRTAVTEVDRQNRELAGAAQIDATGRAGKSAVSAESREGGEVRLLAAKSGEAESAGVSGDVSAALGSERQQALENDLAIALENVDKSRRENQELRQRLESLEEQLNTLQKLISLKDDQLASIQVNASEAQKAEQAAAVVATQPAVSAEPAANVVAETAVAEAPVTEPVAPAEGQVDFNYSAEQSSQTEGAAETAPAEPAVTDDAAAAKAAEEAAARRARIAAMLAAEEEANRPKPGLVDDLIANPQIPLAGLGILALIGVLVARVLKKRKEARAEEAALAEDELAFNDQDMDAGNLDDFDFGDDVLDTDDADQHLDDVDVPEAEEHPEHFETVAQTEDVISESDIYIAYGKFEQAVDLLKDAIAKEPSRSDLRLKLLEVYVEMDEAELFANEEAALQSIGDRAASQQAEQMRNRLSSPIAPVAAAAGAASAVAGLSLDDDIPSLDDDLGGEFADGLDFGDALDMSEDLDGDSGLSDSGLELGDELDLNHDDAGLEEVPTLDLDDGLDHGLDFDLSSDAPVVADEPELKSARDEEAGLDFDLSDFAAEADEPVVAEEVAEVSLDDALEFDLSSFEEESAEDEMSAVVAEDAADEMSLDFDLAADVSEGDELGDLLDGKTEASDEMPDLSFDMEETGFADAGDDDLKDLESELSAMSSVGAGSADDSLDFSEDMSELDAELAGVDADDLAADDTLVLDELADADIPQMDERIEPSIADDLDVSIEGDIDLDELAAADDEFDFLAGTDECATKLDLARAYIDMEDFDGAKELLQEVVQEGSDQQKTDARELMNSLS